MQLVEYIHKLYLFIAKYFVKTGICKKLTCLSTESINILGILELGSIFWMNLVSLEYFLTNKSKNMDLKALVSE